MVGAAELGEVTVTLGNGLPPHLQVQAWDVLTWLEVLWECAKSEGVGGHVGEAGVVTDDPGQGVPLQLAPLCLSEHMAVFPPEPAPQEGAVGSDENAPF